MRFLLTSLGIPVLLAHSAFAPVRETPAPGRLAPGTPALGAPIQGTPVQGTPPQGAPDDKLTSAALPKFLRDMGYEPEKVGDTMQRITIEREKFTFRINVSVSGNQKKVWMSSYLIQIPDLAKAPASAFSDVLLSNGSIGPAHFYLVKADDKHWLKMGFALDNRSITPAYFRSELDWFMERMAETAGLWEKKKWGLEPQD